MKYMIAAGLSAASLLGGVTHYATLEYTSMSERIVRKLVECENAKALEAEHRTSVGTIHDNFAKKYRDISGPTTHCRLKIDREIVQLEQKRFFNDKLSEALGQGKKSVIIPIDEYNKVVPYVYMPSKKIRHAALDHLLQSIGCIRNDAYLDGGKLYESQTNYTITRSDADNYYMYKDFPEYITLFWK